MKFVRLTKSPNPDKKYQITLDDNGKEHNVSFGATGYRDYPTWYKEKGGIVAEIHKESYLKRHGPTETWSAEGILTPGFWSRWVLWSRPTVDASLADVRRRFHL